MRVAAIPVANIAVKEPKEPKTSNAAATNSSFKTRLQEAAPVLALGWDQAQVWAVPIRLNTTMTLKNTMIEMMGTVPQKRPLTLPLLTAMKPPGTKVFEKKS